MKLQAMILGVAGAAVLTPGALAAAQREVASAHHTKQLQSSAHRVGKSSIGRALVSPTPLVSPVLPVLQPPVTDEVTSGAPIWSQIVPGGDQPQAVSAVGLDDAGAC